MKPVLFIGIRPSKANTDQRVPFIGTRSWVRLERWIRLAGIEQFELYNISDDPNGTKFTVKELQRLRSIVREHKHGLVVGLGNQVSKQLKLLALDWCIDFYHAPHPSGRNRLFNNSFLEDDVIHSLKVLSRS